MGRGEPTCLGTLVQLPVPLDRSGGPQRGVLGRASHQVLMLSPPHGGADLCFSFFCRQVHGRGCLGESCPCWGSDQFWGCWGCPMPCHPAEPLPLPAHQASQPQPSSSGWDISHPPAAGPGPTTSPWGGPGWWVPAPSVWGCQGHQHPICPLPASSAMLASLLFQADPPAAADWSSKSAASWWLPILSPAPYLSTFTSWLCTPYLYPHPH